MVHWIALRGPIALHPHVPVDHRKMRHQAPGQQGEVQVDHRVPLMDGHLVGIPDRPHNHVLQGGGDDHRVMGLGHGHRNPY